MTVAFPSTPTADEQPWWPALHAVARREWQQAWQRPADWLMYAMFFVIVSSLFPLALEANPDLLRKVGPGVLWVGATLSVLLSTARLFQDELRNGWLDQWRLSPAPMAALMGVRMLVQWLLLLLPVGAVAPLVALQFGLSGHAIVVLLAGLLLGSACLVMLACTAAAIGAGARGGTMLSVLIVLPLTVPTLVFGSIAVQQAQQDLPADAELALLGGFALFLAILTPWLGGAALTAAIES